MEKIEELKSDFTNLSAQLKKKEKEFDQNRDKLLKEVDITGDRDIKKQYNQRKRGYWWTWKGKKKKGKRTWNR